MGYVTDMLLSVVVSSMG